MSSPVFSPDGRSIAFHAVSDQTLKRIPATGGAAVTICPADIPFGMSWGVDGIVFSEGGKTIRRVSPRGDTPDVLLSLKDGEVSESPQMLPGGQYLLFTVATGTAPNRWDSAQIVAQAIATGERKIIIQGGADARYIPTGHLVYAVGGSLVAVAFDVKTLEATGSPVPMVAGVTRPSAGSGVASFSLSGNGTLVYIPGTTTLSAGQIAIALTDRRRVIQSLKLPAGAYVAPRVDPDGARIAFGTDDGTEANIHIYDLSGATAAQRLTYGGNNRFPIWISSNRIAFQSDREGDLAIFSQSAGGGPAERLTTPEPGTSHVPESWSPKLDEFLFSVKKGPDLSLWRYALRDKKAMPFGDVHSPDPTNAVFSPDGRWVAYASSERNRPTIYLQPFPASGVKYQLPVEASGIASQPLWSPDGKELFYNPGPGRFAWVSVTTQPTMAFGNPEAVPRAFQTGPRTERRAFDITPDGKFVGLIQAGQTESGAPIAPQLRVVLNWFEELKRLVPATK